MYRAQQEHTKKTRHSSAPRTTACLAAKIRAQGRDIYALSRGHVESAHLEKNRKRSHIKCRLELKSAHAHECACSHCLHAALGKACDEATGILKGRCNDKEDLGVPRPHERLRLAFPRYRQVVEAEHVSSIPARSIIGKSGILYDQYSAKKIRKKTIRDLKQVKRNRGR
jgi:hypothetical protein